LFVFFFSKQSGSILSSSRQFFFSLSYLEAKKLFSDDEREKESSITKRDGERE